MLDEGSLFNRYIEPPVFYLTIFHNLLIFLILQFFYWIKLETRFVGIDYSIPFQISGVKFRSHIQFYVNMVPLLPYGEGPKIRPWGPIYLLILWYGVEPFTRLYGRLLPGFLNHLHWSLRVELDDPTPTRP